MSENKPTAEDQLRRFAQAILEDWPDVGGMDGFDMQDLAENCGLLEPHLVTKPYGTMLICIWESYLQRREPLTPSSLPAHKRD